MNAGQYNFFYAAIERILNIGNHIRNWATATFAARNGGDTKRAVIIASILHFDKGARAMMQTRQRLANDRLNIKCLFTIIEKFSDQMIFAIIGYDARYIWKRTGLSRLKRNPASGCDDFIHARACDMTKLAARIRSGFDGHRASVDHRHICVLRGRNDFMSRRAELPRHRFDFALVESATDGIEINLHKSFCHCEWRFSAAWQSHVTIKWEIASLRSQ